MAVILFVLVFLVLVLLSLQPTSILIILILIRQTHLHRVFAYLISSTRQRPSYQLLLSPIYLPVDYPTSKFISCAYICVGTYTTIVGLALAWLGRGSTYSQYAESIDQCLGVERYSFVALLIEL